LLGLVLTLQGLAHSFGRFYKRALSKAWTQSRCFSNPRLVCAFKSPGCTPGRLRHEYEWSSMKKHALLWKRSKLNKSASPRYLVLFPAKSTRLCVLFGLNMTKTTGSGERSNPGGHWLGLIMYFPQCALWRRPPSIHLIVGITNYA
jgi:hypothetical protein